MRFKYKFEDMYNWDARKATRFLPGIVVPDTALGRLHLTGLAKEFLMKGAHTYPFRWKRGKGASR